MEVPLGETKQRTQPLRLSVSKAPENDLGGEPIFVEIEGQQDQVFIGQPLDLVMQIWIRSFRDDSLRVSLSEATLWSLITDESRWGVFEKRIRELDDRGRRPAGHEQLRDDGTGKQRAYHLFEVEATIYPKKPGQIDLSDLRVVIDYPKRLGRPRDPARAMADELFGNSPLSRMLDDDFFGSPMRNRVTVLDSEEHVAEVQTDDTKVLAIPVEDQPASFRGAVGTYDIYTKVNLKRVKVGDPITLQIEIEGDGPLDLVQAPQLEILKDDFIVDDQALAGVVQNETKYFQTKIRPRSEQVEAVPSLEISFFDPKTKEYRIAKSEPIEIRVDEAETLKLDQVIVGDGDDQASEPPTSFANPLSRDATRRFEIAMPDSLSTELPMRNAGKASLWSWWWGGGSAPLLACLIATVVLRRSDLADWLNRLRSAETRAMRELQRAETGEEVGISIAIATGEDRFTNAMGMLRKQGRYQLASDCESLVHQAERGSGSEGGWKQIQAEATELILAITRKSKRLVSVSRPASRAVRSATVACLVCFWGGDARSIAADALEPNPIDSNGLLGERLTDANAAYQAGDFARASSIYDSVLQDGYGDGELHRSAGIAFLKADQAARSIVEFRSALVFEPYRLETWRLLNLARSRAGVERLHLVPPVAMLSVFLASCAALAIVGLLRFGLQKRVSLLWLAAPILIGSASLAFFRTVHMPLWQDSQLVALVDELTIRGGDDDSFETIRQIQDAGGQAFRWEHQRGKWYMIRLDDGEAGWVHRRDVMAIPSIGD